MGDSNQDVGMMSGERHRASTFSNDPKVDGVALARAGFYRTGSDLLKCFSCGLELDKASLDPATSAILLHRERKPDCQFAQTLIPAQDGIRTKTFASYDSLRFERERLETFVEWPVSWLRPVDLAKDGFYYLRTADHCACVFCRGIVGAWEKGDSPRGEHLRHFPHCPFIRRQPVGNVPLEQSEILSKMTPRSPEAPGVPGTPKGVDVCGTPKRMQGSCADMSGSTQKRLVKLEEIGLPRHTGPKRKDFMTYDRRLESFVKWPELLKQKPRELAEAGFFYCGLSDHVRCYHCGNGLRNWESDDQPWVEHARWYPDCSFVIMKQGLDFIDKVRREKPPYIRAQVHTKSSEAPPAASISVSEAELDSLMELDINKAVVAMGFPQDKVRAALCRKLERTGLPFFSLEPCIESVLQYMEEETRLTLREATPRELEGEATARQAAKMQSLQPEDPQSSSASSTSTPPQPSSTSSASTPPQPSSASSASTPPQPSSTSSTSTPHPSSAPSASTPSHPLSTSSTSSSAAPSHPSGVPSTSVPTTSSSSTPALSASTQAEVMEIDEPTAVVPAQPADVIAEADEIMGMAEVALKPRTQGPAPTDGRKASGGGTTQGPSSPRSARRFPSLIAAQTSSELAEELERIHDIRTCKVCMDAEMDVVFLPCQHMVTCSSCALALSECPICRGDIKYSIKPILS